MTKQEKLNRIYEVVMWISKHIKCFDCLRKEQLTYPWTVKWVDWKCEVCLYEWKNMWLISTHTMYYWKCNIGDIISFINKPNKDWVNDNVINLLYHYRSPRKPIDDQGEDCIDFVYSLIKKYA
jgi:hypothetical protein